LPAEGFDFINTEQVFEHLPSPGDDLRRLVQALRPNGVLKIGVPYDPQLRRKLDCPDWIAAKNSPASLNAVAPIEHLNHFEPASLDALCSQAGLVRLSIRGWTLVCAGDAPTYRRPKQRLAMGLRKLTGDFYRPYFALTQTGFFQKPGPTAPASKRP
jgi:SAM-dependent methyltransferase